MDSNLKAARIMAAVAEAQIRAQGFQAVNKAREMQDQYPLYWGDSFTNVVKNMNEKIRQIEGDK